MTSVFRSPAGAAAIRAFVEARYAASGLERHHVATSFGETHLLSAGAPEAPALVLLHGTGSNAMAWLGEIGPLARRYRVIAPDMPGEPGLSADRRLSLARHEPQAWLSELLAGLGIRRMALVGNSLGGWLALGHAIAAPETVSALALMAPSGLAPARASFVWRALGLMLLGPIGERRLNRLIFRDAPVPEEVAAFGRLSARHFRPVTEPVPVYADDALRRLNGRALLYVAGGRDVLLNTPASAERLARLLPQAERDIRPGAGHALMEAGPAIRAFLEKQTAAQG